MAVDVSKIPNNNKFDPVRDAILELEAEIGSGVAGVSSVNGETGAVTIAAGSNVSVVTSANTVTISSTAGGGSLDGELTLAAGTGIGLSSPSVFDGTTDLTVTITNTEIPNNPTITVITGDGLQTSAGLTWSQETQTWSQLNREWSLSEGSEFTLNQSVDKSITISHGNTSNVSDVANTGVTVLQSIGFDQFGHTTSISSVNVLTETDSRYLSFRTINVGTGSVVADLYNDTLTLSPTNGISLSANSSTDTITISGDNKFKFVYTEDDNKTLTPGAYNSILTLNGSPSISVSSDTGTNTVSFALSLNDISFDENGNRIARGLLYYQLSGTPIDSDKPAGTFDFTTYTIDLTGANASKWMENPPQSGSPSVTLYVLRYESVDTGGGTTDARAVDFGDILEATGFEAPVTFSDFTSGGRTIIDGGKIQTGAISSNGFVVGSTPTDYSTEGTKIFLEGNGQNYAGDIISEQFRIVNGTGYFKGNLYVGTNLLTENNTLNSNTTASDVSGLGALATQDTVAAATQVTGLGDLALEDFVNANTQITGLGALALLDAVNASTQVTGLGSLALLDSVTTGQVTGLGALATLDTVSTSLVTGLGALAVLDTLSTSLITGLGDLATLNTVSATTQVTGLGALATQNTVSATTQVTGLGGLALLSQITASEIQAAAVTVDAIANNAITEGKIAANAVTEGKIVANAVVADKIAANAIVSDKIATDAIIASKILAGAITTAKISAGAVTAAKINAGDLAANTAFMNTLLATDGTFTGTMQAGQVTITDNKITLGATNFYSSVGEVIFNNESGNKVADMKATSYGSNEVTLAAYQTAGGTIKANQLILSNNRFFLGDANNAFARTETIAGVDYMIFNADRYQLRGSMPTTAAAANLYINPAANYQLSRSTSSLKYKKDVQDYNKGINEINQLRPVYYKGKEDGDKIYAGLIAEEVHDAGLNEFVMYDADGQPDALAYQNMVSLLIKGMQEQQAQIESLKAEVQALKNNTV